MNTMISIMNPKYSDRMAELCSAMNIPITMTLYGSGTATRTMLNVLGVESLEKRIFITVADDKLSTALIQAERRYLAIDAPGNGIVISVPVKSVGGGETLAFINQNNPEKKKPPELLPDYELVLAIANEGFTDAVMDAAREAGASGGTVIHAKGTGSKNARKFYSVSLASEKEVVMIVAKASDKAAIMRNIVEKAGVETEANAIVFSLPVNAIGGFRLDND